jgi:hypothetical protein
VWKNNFSHLLNLQSVSYVGHIEIYTTELLVHDPSPFEFGICITKLESCKLNSS